MVESSYLELAHPSDFCSLLYSVAVPFSTIPPAEKINGLKEGPSPLYFSCFSRAAISRVLIGSSSAELALIATILIS